MDDREKYSILEFVKYSNMVSEKWRKVFKSGTNFGIPPRTKLYFTYQQLDESEKIIKTNKWYNSYIT